MPSKGPKFLKRDQGNYFCRDHFDEVLAVYRYSEDSLAVEESALYAMRIQVLERYQGDPRCAGFASEFAAAPA